MSGRPEALLVGPETARLVEAIPILQAMLPQQVVLIGGLAVLARLSVPYRSTTDVDAALVHGPAGTSAVELLLAHEAITAAEPTGVLLETPNGTVKVDVIEVHPDDPDPVPEDPNDALYELSHGWAHRTAEPMLLTAARSRDEPPMQAEVLAATPGPLVAMKLQSALNRGPAKEATDLLDIVALVLDEATGPPGLSSLERASPALAAAAAEHAQHWFFRQSARTLRAIRRLPEGAAATAQQVNDVGEALLAALRR